MQELKGWFVYIIRSNINGCYYTGISNDVQRRIKQHNNGTGAKFTRNKGPWVLMGVKSCISKSEALRLEYRIKKLPKSEKLSKVDLCV